MIELPGIQGVKQSQGELKLMADLLLRAPKGKVVLAAVDALLYSSFDLGVYGTIPANPESVPDVCTALWKAVQADDRPCARYPQSATALLELHQQ